MQTYKNIIDNCKSGNEESFILLAEKFMPLIKKYTRILYKDECEDTQQEMLMALWEATQKIEVYDNDGKCTNYFANALRCKFLELYRKSKNYNDNIFTSEDTFMECLESESHPKYSTVNMLQDINVIINSYTEPVNYPPPKSSGFSALMFIKEIIVRQDKKP